MVDGDDVLPGSARDSRLIGTRFVSLSLLVHKILSIFEGHLRSPISQHLP